MESSLSPTKLPVRESPRLPSPSGADQGAGDGHSGRNSEDPCHYRKVLPEPLQGVVGTAECPSLDILHAHTLQRGSPVIRVRTEERLLVVGTGPSRHGWRR